MSLLSTLERFFERLFERPSARLFHARLQPVHLQRRIERAMELDRMSGAERTFVPNRFEVRLHPRDLAAFGDFASSLAAELADGALTFARQHRYALVDRPRVDLLADSKVVPGDIQVEARFATADGGAVNPAAGGARTAGIGVANGAPDPMNRTMVFEIPTTQAPTAVLRERRRDGTEREIHVDGEPLTIGRAGDNAVVIDDSRVSRHHARLHARQGALVFTDLGSTNGSRVNGTRVREVVLGEGDRIELGDSVLVVESMSHS
jgi:hypothetical protein